MIGVQTLKEVSPAIRGLNLTKKELLDLQALTKKPEFQSLVSIAKRLYKESTDAMLHRKPTVPSETAYYWWGHYQRGIEDHEIYMNLAESVENELENRDRASKVKKITQPRRVGLTKPTKAI